MILSIAIIIAGVLLFCAGYAVAANLEGHRSYRLGIDRGRLEERAEQKNRAEKQVSGSTEGKQNSANAR